MLSKILCLFGYHQWGAVQKIWWTNPFILIPGPHHHYYVRTCKDCGKRKKLS